MCGRYFVDQPMAEELYKNFQITMEDSIPEAQDIHPSEKAVVLVMTPSGLGIQKMQWGYPGFEKNQLIFNARSEGVMEKRMFRDSIRSRRLLVPSRGFYEWDGQKNKVTFQREDGNLLLMAGCWQQFGTEQRFVILTTEANESVLPVHHRMPLILEEKDARTWLSDGEQTEFLLHKVPGALRKQSDYEQLAFPFFIS
ncbi:SOS response-associated peptidase [Anaerostipes sp.]|uniref:SOS response-associated peptidase n=1 Tax=Anaerostipes sp. TaxID=1872530 RepID=UPI0025BDBAF1|nr:SOS response-associated peptidase [Anaerostipes sp.]MBS7007342.1 SOS response-associated peptidase [Anaerostipes sp.]